MLNIRSFCINRNKIIVDSNTYTIDSWRGSNAENTIAVQWMQLKDEMIAVSQGTAYVVTAVWNQFTWWIYTKKTIINNDNNPLKG